jgi:hypothetical protein
MWGIAVASLLTILVLSYLLGDNPAYRIALHIFVGAAAGYIAIVILGSMIESQLLNLSRWNEAIADARLNDYVPLVSLAAPALLSLMLLLKLSPRSTFLGNISLALMVGVGAAVAVAGAIVGTILPQVRASWSADPNLINAALINLFTILALLYFFYSRRPNAEGAVRPSPLGRVFGFFPRAAITLTLAALYAGTLATALAVFSDRVQFIIGFINDLLQ